MIHYVKFFYTQARHCVNIFGKLEDQRMKTTRELIDYVIIKKEDVFCRV